MTTVWGMHSRPNDQGTYKFFVDKGYIGIAWARCGDMNDIAPEFEAFVDVTKQTWPGEDYRAIASQLYRFVCVAQIGDVIAYPSPIKSDDTLHIGVITGNYEHIPTFYDYPDVRKVDWRVTTSRQQVDASKLVSLKARLTFFGVLKYPGYYLSLLEG